MNLLLSLALLVLIAVLCLTLLSAALWLRESKRIERRVPQSSPTPRNGKSERHHYAPTTQPAHPN